MTTETELAAARRAYAKTIMVPFHLDDPRLEEAFAEVRREDFLGPGPWQIFNITTGYRPTPDGDPVHLYHDVSIGIMPERGLNNGQPQFLAFLIHLGKLEDGEHAVHVGAGVGYYTAIMARLVGERGSVTAIEYVPELASRAKANLAPFQNVQALQGDGFTMRLEPADVIYVNAGAAQPAQVWLDALKDGGRLILPLTASFTSDQGHAMTRGAIFRIEQREGDYTARWMAGTAIYPCAGARDEASEAALAAAFKKGGWDKVTRLYRTGDIPDENCWVRGPGWSLAYH
jgi:protein-L-isoaspartate(D-aspartate) O-methyltransferase